MMVLNQILMLLVILAAVLPVGADEATIAPPYLFVIESEVESADAGRWAAAVAQTAVAHSNHKDGNSWSAYRQLTGGPNEKVIFLFPVESMAEMDGWKSNRTIVIDAIGQAEGRDVLADLELVESDSDRLMAFRSSLSRPPDTAAPPRYIWLATVRVGDGKTTEFAALFRQLMRAHEEHANGNHWLTYANAIGGDPSELSIAYAFDHFAELDERPSHREVLVAHLGKEKAARLDAALDAVSETTTSLWQLEPALSTTIFE